MLNVWRVHIIYIQYLAVIRTPRTNFFLQLTNYFFPTFTNIFLQLTNYFFPTYVHDFFRLPFSWWLCWRRCSSCWSARRPFSLTASASCDAWKQGDQIGRMLAYWANFPLLGDCLLLAVFWKITEVVRIWGYLFPRLTLCRYYLWEKMGWAEHILGKKIKQGSLGSLMTLWMKEWVPC
jgi:hypothetical protein